VKLPYIAMERTVFYQSQNESCSSGLERQLGGKFHLWLNTTPKPIANKYREGKVESTLERELNVPEIDAEKAVGRLVKNGMRGPSLVVQNKGESCIDPIRIAGARLDCVYITGIQPPYVNEFRLTALETLTIGVKVHHSSYRFSKARDSM